MKTQRQQNCITAFGQNFLKDICKYNAHRSGSDFFKNTIHELRLILNYRK